MSEDNITAEEAAALLTLSLDQNTHALRQVKRRYRAVGVLLALVVLLFGYEIHSHRSNEKNLCYNSNAIRVELNEKFSSLATAVEELGIGGTQGERDALDLFYDDLEMRDCSKIGWFDR